MKKNILIIVFLLIGAIVLGQDTQGPSSIITGHFVKRTIPLRDMLIAQNVAEDEKSEMRIIPNNLRTNEKVVDDALPLNGELNAQRNFGISRSSVIGENFDGATAAEGQATPPDPTGAVGPNHYVHAVNLVVKIFDKQGGLLVGPVSLGNFLGNGASNGDPIVLYDQLEDRWMVSQFNIGNDSLIEAFLRLQTLQVLI